MRDEPAVAPRPSRLRGKAKRLAKVQARSPRRYAVTHDVNGPRVRLGILWFLVLAAALAFDIAALATVYALTAGLAGFQTARAWHPVGRRPNELVAALIGFGLPIVALSGPRPLGGAVLAAAVVSIIGGAAHPEARRAPLANIGFTLQSGLFVGLAGASPVLAYRVDLGAAAALVILVSVYEMGDFLVGSGSKNAVEGPLAGFTAVAVFAFAMWVVTFSPFRDNAMLTFGAIAAGCAPLGQLLASAILPRSDAKAPALRRIDTLIVAGPVWVVALWAYLDLI